MKRLALIAVLALAACTHAPALDPTLVDNAESSFADAKTAAQMNGVSGEALAPIDERAQADLEDMRKALAAGKGADYVRASLKVTSETFAVLSLVQRK